jgi:hypothetical protein
VPEPVRPTPPPRPAIIQRREAQRQATLARSRAEAPSPDPATAVTAHALCPIKGFQWVEASVRLNVVVLRETYADPHQEGWALLTTEDFVDPQAPAREYRRRTTIEERHRHELVVHDHPELDDLHNETHPQIPVEAADQRGRVVTGLQRRFRSA